MEIKPIILCLKHNKMLSLLVILQVAFTLAVVSNSLFVTTATLKEWNLPSGLEHQDIVAVQAQFFDLSIDTRQVIEDDLEGFRRLPGVTNATTASQIPFGADHVEHNRSMRSQWRDAGRDWVCTQFRVEGSDSSVIGGA